MGKAKAEAVNHPQHYQAGGMEAIDVIEAFGLGFCLGNTVKYVLRAGRKGDAVEDLRKAAWYLQREIERRTMDEKQSSAGAGAGEPGGALKPRVGRGPGTPGNRTDSGGSNPPRPTNQLEGSDKSAAANLRAQAGPSGLRRVLAVCGTCDADLTNGPCGCPPGEPRAA